MLWNVNRSSKSICFYSELNVFHYLNACEYIMHVRIMGSACTNCYIVRYKL
jgi:hypothetical protein